MQVDGIRSERMVLAVGGFYRLHDVCLARTRRAAFVELVILESVYVGRIADVG